MPRQETLIVRNWSQLLRGINTLDKESKKALRDTLKQAGRAVQVDSQIRLARYAPRSAASIKTSVQVRGVRVYQARRKTTGRRGDFGRLQMKKALVPALRDNEATTARLLERALNQVVDHFNRQGAHGVVADR